MSNKKNIYEELSMISLMVFVIMLFVIFIFFIIPSNNNQNDRNSELKDRLGKINDCLVQISNHEKCDIDDL